MKTKLVQVLLDAADMIKGGWLQHRSRRVTDDRQFVCLLTALDDAASKNAASDYEWYSLFNEAYGQVQKKVDFRSLAIWNDDPFRTQEEVVQMLRDAAQIAQQETETRENPV